jgi:hypothetical protein
MNATGGAAVSEGRAGIPSLLCGSERAQRNAGIPREQGMNERARYGEAHDGMPSRLGMSGRAERGKGLPKAGWA